MSNFSVPIVEIRSFDRVPDSDNLCITDVCGFPIIFLAGDFQVGDHAAFVPEESLLPNKPQFSFMWNNKENPSESDRVVRAKRLRKKFSCGLLITLPEECKNLPVGTDLSNTLGITKYEQPEPVVIGGDNESRPAWFPTYTEIENLRKYSSVFTVGEKVVATEKIHGSCSSFTFYDNRLWISSHHNVKKLDGKTCWNFIAKEYHLEDRLQDIPGMIVFGEVYGPIQKGFHYGSPKEPSFIVFDIYDIQNRRYLDYSNALDTTNYIGLKFAPIIYYGPWIGIEHIKPFADGPSILGNGAHIREGLVIKCAKERWSEDIRRCVLKLHGEEYLLRKGKK